jgi:hypothetical protein
MYQVKREPTFKFVRLRADPEHNVLEKEHSATTNLTIVIIPMTIIVISEKFENTLVVRIIERASVRACQTFVFQGVLEQCHI